MSRLGKRRYHIFHWSLTIIIIAYCERTGRGTLLEFLKAIQFEAILQNDPRHVGHPWPEPLQTIIRDAWKFAAASLEQYQSEKSSSAEFWPTTNLKRILPSFRQFVSHGPGCSASPTSICTHDQWRLLFGSGFQSA